MNASKAPDLFIKSLLFTVPSCNTDQGVQELTEFFGDENQKEKHNESNMV